MPRQSMVVLTEAMFYVLMAFQTGEKCGIEIVELVEKITRGRVQLGPATLYTILGKFEKEKYIKEVQVEGRKRTYVILEKGIKAYQEEMVRLRQCIADAESMEI